MVLKPCGHPCFGPLSSQLHELMDADLNLLAKVLTRLSTKSGLDSQDEQWSLTHTEDAISRNTVLLKKYCSKRQLTIAFSFISLEDSMMHQDHSWYKNFHLVRNSIFDTILPVYQPTQGTRSGTQSPRSGNLNSSALPAEMRAENPQRQEEPKQKPSRRLNLPNQRESTHREHVGDTL